jgi:hypothetical protein
MRSAQVLTNRGDSMSETVAKNTHLARASHDLPDDNNYWTLKRAAQ